MIYNPFLYYTDFPVIYQPVKQIPAKNIPTAQLENILPESDYPCSPKKSGKAMTALPPALPVFGPVLPKKKSFAICASDFPAVPDRLFLFLVCAPQQIIHFNPAGVYLRQTDEDSPADIPFLLGLLNPDHLQKCMDDFVRPDL